MANQNTAHNDEKFLTHHSVEIAQILNELAKNKTTLNLSFNYGKDQGLTTVIGVSRDKRFVYLDKSLDPGFNKRLLNSDSITISKTDGIKIRWSTKQLTEVRLKDGDAFKMVLPTRLYRFQRREFFRSLTPTIDPVLCYISYINPIDKTEESLAITLVDVSLGGIGTLSDHLFSLLALEKVFSRCSITLPHLGVLETSLCVKHITETVMLNGSKKFRVGFEFVGLSRNQERPLQQYVTQLEREALVLAKGE